MQVIRRARSRPLLRAALMLGLALTVLSPGASAWARKTGAAKPSFSLPAATAWPNPSGRYTIQPSNGVNASSLVLQPNGRYDWFLIAPNGSLESHGVWQQDASQGLVTLSTDPLPASVPFVLQGPAPGDPWPVSEGDLHLRVARFALNGVDNDRPVPGVHVVCEGLLRTVDTVTSGNGWANCQGVGLPLRRLSLNMDGLPNAGTFDNPRVNGRSWAVGFDLNAARNALVFQGEAWWQQDDGSLMWQPRALPQAPVWTYVPNGS